MTQELLSKYGGLMPVEQHEVLQDALLPMLDEQRGALRKRAINVVGAARLHRPVHSCPWAGPMLLRLSVDEMAVQPLCAASCLKQAQSSLNACRSQCHAPVMRAPAVSLRHLW